MNGARFIERETQVEVTITCHPIWEPYPMVAIVTYPSGRTYGIPADDIGKYFDIVTPQEVFITARGGDGFDRPTPLQKA